MKAASVVCIKTLFRVLEFWMARVRILLMPYGAMDLLELGSVHLGHCSLMEFYMIVEGTRLRWSACITRVCCSKSCVVYPPALTAFIEVYISLTHGIHWPEDATTIHYASSWYYFSRRVMYSCREP